MERAFQCIVWLESVGCLSSACRVWTLSDSRYRVSVSVTGWLVLVKSLSVLKACLRIKMPQHLQVISGRILKICSQNYWAEHDIVSAYHFHSSVSRAKNWQAEGLTRFESVSLCQALSVLSFLPELMPCVILDFIHLGVVHSEASSSRQYSLRPSDWVIVDVFQILVAIWWYRDGAWLQGIEMSGLIIATPVALATLDIYTTWVVIEWWYLKASAIWLTSLEVCELTLQNTATSIQKNIVLIRARNLCRLCNKRCKWSIESVHSLGELRQLQNVCNPIWTRRQLLTRRGWADCISWGEYSEYSPLFPKRFSISSQDLGLDHSKSCFQCLHWKPERKVLPDKHWRLWSLHHYSIMIAAHIPVPFMKLGKMFESRVWKELSIAFFHFP